MTQRPGIQEVVKGVGDAAANWHTDMPPSLTEQSEDSTAGQESDGHGGFPSFPKQISIVLELFYSSNAQDLSKRRPTAC